MARSASQIIKGWRVAFESQRDRQDRHKGILGAPLVMNLKTPLQKCALDPPLDCSEGM